MFRTVEERDGYLAIEDHGLIGDGATAGLVGRSGAIDWLCVPRFDSEPLFGSCCDPSAPSAAQRGCGSRSSRAAAHPPRQRMPECAFTSPAN